MPIFYSVICRGAVILAKYATCAGNFAEVTEQILTKIDPNEASQLTYTHASCLFHYIARDGVVYLCITDDEFDRRRAFLFLEDISHHFQSTYGSRIQSAVPYAMNSEFAQEMSSRMKHFSESRDIDKVTRMQGEVNDVKDILVKNIETLASRGERLELLIDKTESLNTTSVSFKSTSRTLARSLWWKNIRLIVFMIISLGIGIYLIGSLVCGFTWQECTSGK